MDEKLEEIKKKINTEPEKKIKNTVITKSEEVKEPKVAPKEDLDIPANLNRLSTIQEQAREDEEFNSFRAVPQIEEKEEEGEGEKKEKTE